jgi:hypothetical protein
MRQSSGEVGWGHPEETTAQFDITDVAVIPDQGADDAAMRGRFQLTSNLSRDSRSQPPHGGVGAGFVYSSGMIGGNGEGSGVEIGWHTDRCTMSCSCRYRIFLLINSTVSHMVSLDRI